MKDVIKTAIVVGVIMLILCVSFFIVGNAEYGVKLLTQTKLDLKDPTVELLYGRVKDNTELRKAYLVNEDLTSEEIIKFTLDNITKNEYETKTITPDKIVCQVTNTIKFTSDTKCKIRVINNKTIMEYQEKYFNTSNELEYEDIKYHGLYCKNSGKKYYCLVNKFNDSLIGYSLFSDAYKEKDKVVIREYYLQIDLTDKERCLNYFNEEYCNNYLKQDKPTISDKTIKDDGVLYEHVYVKKDDTYYLESSFVVSER